jgi:predicted GIY-YIG superfamily endonuclease
MTHKIYIYRISNLEDSDQFYIGSTKNYKKRMQYHKSDCYNETSLKYNRPLYQCMRANGGWDAFKKEIFACKTVADVTEQRKYEQLFIKTLKPPLNKWNAYTSPEEAKQQQKERGKSEKHKKACKAYYEANKEHCKQKAKEWEERNKDKRRQQKSEPCGYATWTINKLKRHQSSLKHQQKLNLICV